MATETFYCLAANPLDLRALEAIFTLKGRHSTKELPLIAASRDDVNSALTNVNHFASDLMDRFWPGSLTLVLETQRSFPGSITNNYGKIAVRVPPDCPARELARLSGGWITSTSANRSGEPPACDVPGISTSILHGVDFIIDSGASTGGSPSTIVEPLIDRIVLLREGAISAQNIEEKLGVALWKN